MKNHIVRTSMYIEKTKFKYYLWNYACYLKKFARIDGASDQRRKLQINKNYTLSHLPSYGEFENLCFVFVAWTVSVSRAFVYNAVDINKLLPLSWQNHHHRQMRNRFKSYFYSLLDWPTTGEDFKPNPSTVDKCKLKLWLQM